MEKDKKQDPRPEQASDDAVIKKLTEMEEKIIAISKRRTQRSMVMIGGIFLILFFVVLFLVQLLNMAKEFDEKELMIELQKEAVRIAESQEVKSLTTEVQTEVVPLLRDEIVKQFNARTDEIHDKAVASAKNLQLYLEDDVQKKLKDEVGVAIIQLEQEILKKYPNIPSERLEKVIKAAKEEFITRLTASLEDRLNRALTDISVLAKTFDKLKTHPEYQKLSQKDISKIENKLLESVLELAIYNVNPDKGDMPANSQGGGAK